MKLSSLTGTLEQRVVLFGPPKSGKTELAGKLAEHYKILFLSLENGHVTLTKLPRAWQERIEVINIRDSRVYPIAIETMMKIAKGDAVNICVTHSKVSCPVCSKKPDALIERVCLNELGLDWVVVIDSLTQLTNSGIAHITKNQPDDYKLQLDDWGALKVLMDKFLSQIQVARYNVVCITHEEEVKFEDGRTKIVPVAGSANSSRNTAKYFDHVVYTNLTNKKHTVGSATDYSLSVLTGSRTDVKLESIAGASLLDIFTNWKLPNFGMPIPEGEVLDERESERLQDGTREANGSGVLNKELVSVGNNNNSSMVSSNSTGNMVDNTKPLTPGEQALENLKAMRSKGK